MQQVKLTLPMIPNMELTASKTACAMGEQIGLSADKIDEIQMAVVEACINAFEHSGAQDREVRISLQVLGTEIEPNGLQITIRDAGVGFSPDKLPKRKTEENPKAPRKRGHGLRIIRGLMDEVDFRSDTEGTTVVMRKMR
ncbi:MAG: ATP-binding protein [Acidobacteriota bacterium]